MYVFGMRFSLSKYEIRLRYLFFAKSNLVLVGEQVGAVDRFGHLDGCIASGGRNFGKSIFVRIQGLINICYYEVSVASV